MAIIVLVHMVFSPILRQEITVVVVAGMLGYTWESALSALTIINYPAVPAGQLAPYWMFALWANFALTINWSLSWFKKHLVIASLAGLVFAPAAYYAGYRLGALEFSSLWQAMIVIGAGWAVLFPFLAWYANALLNHKSDDTSDQSSGDPTNV